MLILFIIVFINLVGFGIIIPLLPFYGEHFDASPDQVINGGIFFCTIFFSATLGKAK